jgi:hypothetical protein
VSIHITSGLPIHITSGLPIHITSRLPIHITSGLPWSYKIFAQLAPEKKGTRWTMRCVRSAYYPREDESAITEAWVGYLPTKSLDAMMGTSNGCIMSQRP